MGFYAELGKPPINQNARPVEAATAAVSWSLS